ncbi:DUF6036 family nucleotidyltransferase [Aquibacillus sp. 3ASR75-11]|uniref:DUF6036 family nucleotidyltransferase n=1 Tax=Terrihalobacillus insolitus TaxID=2950438 RepID=A0A9X3WV04_9BACI|nr:DUF6036 family nucleotidyltransferase [Terrihalobacillus insolitus]MDC3413529.1 DUF6036 family nucleotidyltransferase [Terrihalobacillus insolitus]MDC3426185.1 DUF6036 family nucleotidyltransferase [Terrihalobacillus insolitus]
MSKLEKITKELFLNIMEVLDEKLEENRLKMTLNIYGGTVMMTCFDARPATKDVDAIFETSSLIDTILLGIAETYGLNKDWINQDIKEPLKYVKRENLKEIYKFRNLRVLAPSAEQMLAMKILSARPEPYRDFNDVEFLLKYLEIDTLEQVVNVFDKYVGRRYLGDRQKMFLNYVGEDLKKSWKKFSI